MGCNNYASIKSLDSTVTYGGCSSRCEQSGSIVIFNASSCNGFNCCQIAIPSDLNAFTTDLDQFIHNDTSQECRYAFLEQEWFETNNAVPNLSSVPVVLEWGIRNTSFHSLHPVRYNSISSDTSQTYNCSVHSPSESNQNLSFSCSCKSGYEGNPYLPGGCQDINECEAPDGNPCLKNWPKENVSSNYANHSCENTNGSYACHMIPYTHEGPSKAMKLIIDGAADVINSKCQAQYCGNVNITYPFGIGAGCYLDDWFEIVCDGEGNSSDPATARPYLRRLIPRLEVLEIQIEDSSPYSEASTVRVNFPILRTCGTSPSYNASASLEGSPFLFSDINNSFVAMGCNNLALMTSVDGRVSYGGCTNDPIHCTNSTTSTNSSSCNRSDNCYCDLNAIPSGLVRFNTIIRPAKPQDNSGGCKSAFLVDRFWFSQNNFTMSNPLLHPSYVPVVLEWGINRTVRDSLYPTGSTTGAPWDRALVVTVVILLVTLPTTTVIACTAGGNPKTCLFPTDLFVIAISDIDECELARAEGRNPCGSKRCKNTSGYYRCLRDPIVYIIIDPEYFQSSQFTEKSDVYSFGVVLAELLTGEKAISSSRTLQDKSLATYFIQSMEENNLFDILDKRVLKEAEKQEIIAIANLANRCLNLNGKKRPKMKEVSVELEGIQMLRKAPNDQQNNEVIEDDRIEMHEQWDVLSTSSMSGADGGIALQPLLFKSG
ncbi:Wall-associated receptor kinase-like 9 [Morella rubra]|uniref:Wall-associated receptor kinase-like 9 n=1 Tax=Morella rubra TaxID=262757 RepID=A0A6A1VFK9_9ROSI|nr:Wall-associated receptor kinase-like 9 [Morella rubra]